VIDVIMVLVTMMLVRRRLAGAGERLLVEPARDIDRFFLGVHQGGTEQIGRIDLAMHHALDLRAQAGFVTRLNEMREASSLQTWTNSQPIPR